MITDSTQTAIRLLSSTGYLRFKPVVLPPENIYEILKFANNLLETNAFKLHQPYNALSSATFSHLRKSTSYFPNINHPHSSAPLTMELFIVLILKQISGLCFSRWNPSKTLVIWPPGRKLIRKYGRSLDTLSDLFLLRCCAGPALLGHLSAYTSFTSWHNA